MELSVHPKSSNPRSSLRRSLMVGVRSIVFIVVVSIVSDYRFVGYFLAASMLAAISGSTLSAKVSIVCFLVPFAHSIAAP